MPQLAITSAFDLEKCDCDERTRRSAGECPLKVRLTDKIIFRLFVPEIFAPGMLAGLCRSFTREPSLLDQPLRRFLQLKRLRNYRVAIS